MKKNKEKLQQQVQDCYENISEEEKDWKRGYGRSWYKNVPKKDKQKPKENRKSINIQD